MWPNPQVNVDLLTFTEEILNGKLHFLCSDIFTCDMSYFASYADDNTPYTVQKNTREVV